MMISLINIYNIILESYVIFVIFAIFFFVLIKYIITPYEIEIVKGFAIKTLKNYGINEMVQLSSYFSDIIIDTQQKLNTAAIIEKSEVDAFNIEYENTQIYILIGMTFGILILMLIPILIGIIKFSDINWTKLLLVFFINTVIILVCEALFFIYIIGNYNTIRFYPLLEIGREL